MRNLWYYENSTLHAAKNAAGEDYTPAYLTALTAHLGVFARPCDSFEHLGERDVLLIGAEQIDAIPEGLGGVILLGTSVGKPAKTVIREQRVQAYLLGEDGMRLPLFVPVFPVLDGEETLAFAETDDGRVPAIVRLQTGVYAFGFDLAATVWYSGDGFPQETSPHGFFIGRTPDTRPLPLEHDTSIAYNDEILAILGDLLHALEVPMLHTLPPMQDGSAPDFAFHISGDDDCTSAEYDLTATRVMHERGFPYHINAMPVDGRFVITREQAQEILRLGGELALHGDFTAHPYTEDGHKVQAALFEKSFGFRTRTNTNHCFIQGATAAERMRWLESAGIVADNGKLGEIDPSDINAFNLSGYAFGTAFPRYTCDDPAHGNRRIGTLEIPITYYEPRYSRGETEKYDHPERITGYVDAAARHARIVQFFLHPHYLAPDRANTRYALAALDLAKAHWEEQGYRPYLTTTDAVAAFWHARANTVLLAENETRLTVKSDAPMLLRLPSGVKRVKIDDIETQIQTRRVRGEEIALVAIPAGRKIAVELDK